MIYFDKWWNAVFQRRTFVCPCSHAKFLFIFPNEQPTIAQCYLCARRYVREGKNDSSFVELTNKSTLLIQIGSAIEKKVIENASISRRLRESEDTFLLKILQIQTSRGISLRDEKRFWRSKLPLETCCTIFFSPFHWILNIGITWRSHIVNSFSKEQKFVSQFTSSSYCLSWGKTNPSRRG